MGSLWGEEFDLFVDSVATTKSILKKARSSKEVVISEKSLTSKSIPLSERIKFIENKVLEVLGKQVNNVFVIHDRKGLKEYIDSAILNGVIAIDTETNNSLDPITCKLMGLCLYTPNNKQVYIPVNHVDSETNVKLESQVTEQDIKEELQRILDTKTKVIMHNAKFDYEVLKCTCNIEIMADWDTLIAAKLINENEPAGLKMQYILHIDPDQQKYSIENLFEKLEYAIFPPEIFALYAATDAMMTYRLYAEYQKDIMESEDFKKIYKLFLDTEMPCVKVVAEMELTGVELDIEYSKRLSKKYHDKLIAIDAQVSKELEKYKELIDAWRLSPEANYKEEHRTYPSEEDYMNHDFLVKKYPLVEPDGTRYKLTVKKSKAEQLEDTINLASPSQLAILLYDIIKVRVVDDESPRGTGVEILKALKDEVPLCSLLLERRAIVKLLDAFIDVLPEKVNVDGRIHCHFNQYGADTGRFSCSEPNLQQIPSHNKEIRMMFKAKDGNVLVGSDFSQQEPRLLSQLSGDENMINAYKSGKDLYATIASGVYKMDYWDCMEHHEDGSASPEGKKRRGSCKSLLLGIMYSRGTASIAEQIKGTKEEAQGIVDNFFLSFSRVKDTIDASHEMAKKYGYVEDLWGRRRRLPEIQKEKYEITYSGKNDADFNPIIGCSDRVKANPVIEKYRSMLNEARSRKDVNDIIALAKKRGLDVKDNSSIIAQAERQCLNARIQGSAATMTKKAMIKLFEDKELNQLGFKMLIGVHDELIGECPKENADAVAERLTYVMKTCVQEEVSVPFKCDADVCEHWYYNDYCDVLKADFQDLIAQGVDRDTALRAEIKEHAELSAEEIRAILEN